MKKTVTICVLLCLMVITCLQLTAYATDTQVDSNVLIGGLERNCHSADAQTALLGSDELVKNAKAVFLYELNSETLLYAWNADVGMEPASLVKIMTAFVAIEEGTLTDAVTVKQNVIDSVPKNTVSADLVADEVMTLEDLLYCMMVGSASDASVVIADHIAGSQDDFVRLMNDRAAQLGCTGTHFTNTHGLYDKEQHMTARDVAKILAAALENETFAKVFGTVHHTIPATNKSAERNLITGNYLMSTDDVKIYYDPRVTGGRTGVVNDGSRCLAACSEVDGMKIVSVVMGSASVYQENGNKVNSFGGYPETTSLLDIAFNNYKTVRVLYEGQVLAQKDVINGANDVTLGSNVAVAAVLPSDVTSEQLQFRYVDGSGSITAPIAKGEQVASVEIWHDNFCVAQTDLFAMNDVALAGTLVVGEDGHNFNWWLLLWIIPVISVVICVWFLVRRYGHKFKALFGIKGKRHRCVPNRGGH